MLFLWCTFSLGNKSLPIIFSMTIMCSNTYPSFFTLRGCQSALIWIYPPPWFLLPPFQLPFFFPDCSFPQHTAHCLLSFWRNRPHFSQGILASSSRQDGQCNCPDEGLNRFLHAVQTRSMSLRYQGATTEKLSNSEIGLNKTYQREEIISIALRSVTAGEELQCEFGFDLFPLVVQEQMHPCNQSMYQFREQIFLMGLFS